MTGELHVSTDDGVCTMKIDNPGKRNALSYEIIQAIGDEFQALDSRDEVVVVVLRGAGKKAFSAGFDLSIDRTTQTEEEKALWPRMIDAVKSYDFPTIAMVNGHTYGGAMELMSSCDLRVGVLDADFGITPARLGIVYSGDAIGEVMNLIGPAKTKELLFTAEPFGAAHAEEIGLLNYAVDRDELEDRTYSLAETMAKNAPNSLKYMKEIVHTLEKKQAMTEAEQKWVSRIRDESFKSEDHKEGVEAFNEGREPDFSGR